jgi:hypothetical protein
MTTTISSQLPTLESGVSVWIPSCWCETQEGKVIRVNGLDRGSIWNGLNELWDLGILAPTVAPTVSGPDYGVEGSLDATYWLAYRYRDADGNVSSLSPLFELAVAAKAYFNWQTVPNSAESRVTQIELFRSTGDQADVLYRVATLTQPTASYNSGDNASDEVLRASDLNDILPILNADGTQHANRHDPPPYSKSVCISFQDRFWYLVEAVYNEGHITISGTIVTGVETAFPDGLAGRYLWVDGLTEPLEIQSRDTLQQLTLVSAPPAPIINANPYAITGNNIDKNRVWFSSVNPRTGKPEPESVCNQLDDNDEVIQQNALDIQDNTADPDAITGGFPHGSTLWLMKQRHAYRLNFVADPAIDASVKLAISRGMLNQRCWAQLGGTVYLLDEYGPWWMDSQGAQEMAISIADYFRDSQIEWGMSRWFFVSVNQQERVVRFHVVLGSDSSDRPQTALCFAVDAQVWWVEKYPVELSGSCSINQGVRSQVLVGGPLGRCLVLGDGTSDLVSGAGDGYIWENNLGGFCDPLATFQEGTVGGTVSISTQARTASYGISDIRYSGFVHTPFSATVAAGDTFTFDVAGGSYIVTYTSSGRIVSFSSITDEFTSAIVGDKVNMTSGLAAAEDSKTVNSIFAPVLLISPDFRSDDWISDEYKVHYFVQQAIIGTSTNTPGGDQTILQDTTTTFPEHIQGAPIAIIDGTGKGQVYYVASTYTAGMNYLDIVEADGTTEAEWSPELDDTSRYMVGAIECTYQSGREELPVDRPEDRKPAPSIKRELTVAYKPTVEQLVLDMQLLYDHETSPETFPTAYSKGPISVQAGADEAVIDTRAARSSLGNAPGVASFPLHGRAHSRAIAHRHLATQLHAFQGPEVVEIRSLEIRGAD